MPTVTAMADIRLNTAYTIPQLGFGTYLVDPDDTEAVVAQALELGYRHIDPLRATATKPVSAPR